MIWILLVAVLIVSIIVVSYAKRLRYGNLTLVTGGVKTGKTELCVKMVFNQWRRQMRKYRWGCFKSWLFRKPKPERPLIYSNMPIGKIKKHSYVPLTLDLIKRKQRFAYGSVVYFNEVSFLAGSKDIRDEDVNDILLQLFKLCAHETRGGYFIIDTQSPMDMHYTIKRSLSTYYNIVRRTTLPFISFLWLREQVLIDGEHSSAIENTDPDDAKHEGLKPLYFLPILNRWWKYYDRYAYSVLTDNLPVATDAVKVQKNKKITGLVRLRKG